MNYVLLRFKFLLLLAGFFLQAGFCYSQLVISGTVYDSTKVYSVSGVQVKSTGGAFTFTDSAGVYHIQVAGNDSLSFFYRNKPTMKFPVSAIADYTQFDISLRIVVKEKYKPLKEIFVYSNYRHDSAQNRNEYYKAFSYEKPGIKSTYTPGSPAGFDLDELVNIFRFRRNKQNLQFQKRLLEQEQDRYVDYRFSTRFLKRVTGLSGPSLEKYKIEYRPSYQLITSITELEYYEYITNTCAKFKKDMVRQGDTTPPDSPD